MMNLLQIVSEDSFMSETFNFCGTSTLHEDMLKRREARIVAGNTKLAKLSKEAGEALEAYNKFRKNTRDEQNQQGNPLAWLQSSPKYAAFQAAEDALFEFEKELNAADAKRIKEIEKRLSVLKDAAAENGLSEEANAEMDALEAELQKLEFPWL